ncbi:Mov34/MPN/PAD-1 family protein [Vibrio fluvialis]
MCNFEDKETGIIIRIEEQALDILLANRQTKSGFESGGLLFSPLTSENIVYITHVSTPSELDLRRQLFFKHDKSTAQKTISHFFKKGLHYIGDWHSHPQDKPQPSPQDIQSMKDIFLKSKHSLNFMLHIIVGIDEDCNKFYVCLTNGTKIHQCSPRK